MLHLIDYSNNRDASTRLSAEDLRQKKGKILVINTRSYSSDLTEQEEIQDKKDKLKEQIKKAQLSEVQVPYSDASLTPVMVHVSTGSPESSTDVLTPQEEDKLSKENNQKKHDFFVRLLKENDDLQKEGVPEYDVAQVSRLMLSADQGPEEWVQIANLIEEHYFKYDGFVVQNGSDGMVYAASALSFMLENLGKPVIFTGSLIPARRLYTDMKRNTILSLMLASCHQLSEVCILFDDRLYRANRCIKVSRSSLKPFASPHYPPLAIMSGSLKLIGPLLRPQPHGRFRVMREMKADILTMRIGPNVPLKGLLTMLRHSEARACIIYCYGSGNAPARGSFMQKIMKCAVEEKNMLVVITTQNKFGKVELGQYELGRKLLELGAVDSGDMTAETVYVKLKYLYGLGLSNAEVRTYMGIDLRGERTVFTSKI